MDPSLPIYIQISQYIQNEILKGHLSQGDKVPSTNEFARTMQVNPATAGKGLNELVDQGILYKKRGLGMFVTKEALNIVRENRQESFKIDNLPNLVRTARQLNITQDQLIELIRSEYDAQSN